MTAVFISPGYSQENTNPFDVQVTVSPLGERLQINASYSVPINICSAYAFITDYEASKNIPGIIDAKIVLRLGNKVRVRRVIEEEILFFPVQLKSIVEYTEVPYQLLSFEQISGDAKFYKGTWKLLTDKDKIVFKYDSVVELDSIIPSLVISYFIKNNIRNRFEVMAKKAAQYKAVEVGACK